MPQMANVLKVFLENGQTKSFKYDSTTTVRVSNPFSFFFFYSLFVQQFNRCVSLFSFRNTVCIRTSIHMFLLYAAKYEQILRFIVNCLKCMVVHFGLLLFTSLGRTRVVRLILEKEIGFFAMRNFDENINEAQKFHINFKLYA